MLPARAPGTGRGAIPSAASRIQKLKLVIRMEQIVHQEVNAVLVFVLMEFVVIVPAMALAKLAIYQVI